MSKYCTSPIFWLLLVACTFSIGCEGESTELELSDVSMPNGGTVCSVTVARNGRQLASTEGALFAREEPGDDWGAISATLSGSVFDYRGCLEMTEVRGYLWAMLRAGDGMARLYTSRDSGETWERVRLPFRPPSEQSADLFRVTGQSVSRNDISLLSRGESLFVLYQNQVWQYRQVGQKDPWKPVGLDGTILENYSSGLPPVIQAYLPSGRAGRSELLAIRAEQLLLYRRADERREWNLVSVLPASARHLKPVPKSDSVLLHTRQGIYRAAPPFENWENIYSPSDSTPINAVSVVGEKPIVLVGLADGQILKSESFGETWDSVKGADMDSRGVTGFTPFESGRGILAFTTGNGVWRSGATGSEWSRDNIGLAATSPTSVTSRSDETFVMGTDSGLYQAVPGETTPEWQRLNSRFITAVESPSKSNRLWAGTSTGAILRFEDGQSQKYSVNSSKDIGPFSMALAGSYKSGAIASLKSIRYDGAKALLALVQGRGIVRLDPKTGEVDSLRWNEAFKEVVDGDAFRDWLVVDSKLFVLSESVARPGLYRVWRVPFRDEQPGPLEMRRIELDSAASPVVMAKSSAIRDEPSVVLAYNNQIEWLQPDGQTWETLSGSWPKGIFTSHAAGDKLDTFFVQSDVQDWFIVSERPGGAENSTYRIKWPEGEASRAQVVDLLLYESAIYVITEETLLVGYIPQLQRRLSNGVAIILTITGVLVVTALAFILLKLV